MVGLPGLLLALWVRSLREPVRGQADGVAAIVEARPWREFWRELSAVLPPFTLANLWWRGGRWRTLTANLLAAVDCVSTAAGLTRLLGNPVQWYSLAIGLYAAVSWAQSLRLRDPACFALVLRMPSLQAANLAVALLAFTSYGYGFWIAPYLIRTHGENVARVGLILGGIAAGSGWLGVTLGGILADRLRQRSPTGRLRVGMLAAVLPVPFAVLLLLAPSLTVAYLVCVPLFVTTSLWLGPGASTVQDLVLPRMRAVASAAYLLVVTFIGLALGPYTVGRLSVALGGLRPALLWALLANGLSLGCALYAARRLPGDEESRWERAQAAGEGAP